MFTSEQRSTVVWWGGIPTTIEQLCILATKYTKSELTAQNIALEALGSARRAAQSQAWDIRHIDAIWKRAFSWCEADTPERTQSGCIMRMALLGELSKGYRPPDQLSTEAPTSID